MLSEAAKTNGKNSEVSERRSEREEGMEPTKRLGCYAVLVVVERASVGEELLMPRT